MKSNETVATYPEITLADEYREAVLAGKKTTTIRRGIRSYGLGPATIGGIPITITKLEAKRRGAITQGEVWSDGFETFAELWEALESIYGPTSYNELFTVVTFRVNENV